jgi:hypothetical protein
VDGITGQASPSGATATLATGALPSDNPVSRRRQRGRGRLTHFGTLILHGLAKALFSAAIGAVAAASAVVAIGGPETQVQTASGGPCHELLRGPQGMAEYVNLAYACNWVQSTIRSDGGEALRRRTQSLGH